MNNRITYIGLYAFSLYSLIMSLICGIIVLLLVMLCRTLFLYCYEINYVRLALAAPMFVLGRAIIMASILYSVALGVKLSKRESRFMETYVEYEKQIGLDPFIPSTFRLLMAYASCLPLYYPMWQLMLFVQNKKKKVMYTSNTVLEICWTILPIIVLIVIMLPSLVLLYAMDDVSIAFGNVTMKVIGHQWYWSYQHVNMSPELMPIFHDINKKVYINADWLSTLKKI